MQLKLHKTAEHGFGEHILALYSSVYENSDGFLQTYFHSKWKVHYIYVDLKNNQKELKEKFINTLNHFHYAKHIILDYPAFLLLLANIEKIHLTHEQLEKIIIVNPSTLKKNWFEKIFNIKKFLSLNGLKVPLPKHFNEEVLEKLHFLKSKSVMVISLDNHDKIFKIAAKLPNSKFKIEKKYQKALRFIKGEFD
jgi:hypothetical protein